HHVKDVENQKYHDGRQVKAPHGRYDVAYRPHHRLGDLGNQLNGGVTTLWGYPADNHYRDDRPEVDLDNQTGHVKHRPDQNSQRVDGRNATVHRGHDQEKGDGLNDDGQYQRRTVNATPTRDDPAQRA